MRRDFGDLGADAGGASAAVAAAGYHRAAVVTVSSCRVRLGAATRLVAATSGRTTSSCLLSNLVAAALFVYDLGVHVGGGRRMAFSQRVRTLAYGRGALGLQRLTAHGPGHITLAYGRGAPGLRRLTVSMSDVRARGE